MTNSQKIVLSGHETFPLRFLWLKRAIDSIDGHNDDSKEVFTDVDAISRFGVGKNMVASIRHWAIISKVITAEASGYSITPFGRLVFGGEGIDPFFEFEVTPLLVHWNIVSNPSIFAWHHAFSSFPDNEFGRDDISNWIISKLTSLAASKISSNTVKKDVACFIRTYALSSAPSESDSEAYESPLTTIGFIVQYGKRDGFRFIVKQASEIPLGAFMFALVDYWRNSERFSNSNTIPLVSIKSDPKSVGRLFRISPIGVEELAVRLANDYSELFGVVLTGGMSHISIKRSIHELSLETIVKEAYELSA
ncbi:DUF4007 family protein [Acidithrix ferrooxidans]|uniref:DUF4007 family protein n=1 Tax=Acidithrix ferrooxidans TaxID=1280514 RepID=UPI000698E028|nr:DUF4007 family protein [Acidithrix ferrooxidans]